MPIEIGLLFFFCSFDYRIARIRIFLCRLKLIRSEWICICVSDSMHSSDCLPIKWLKSSKMCVYLSLLSFLLSFSLPQCLCMLHIWIDMRKCGKRVHEKCILGKCFFGRAGLPLFMCIEEIKCAIIPRNCTRPNPKIIMALVQSLGCGYTTATTHTHTQKTSNERLHQFKCILARNAPNDIPTEHTHTSFKIRFTYHTLVTKSLTYHATFWSSVRTQHTYTHTWMEQSGSIRRIVWSFNAT